MKRKPFFAGRFYPGSKAMLLEELKSYVPSEKRKVKALGIISPHAGYVYSGKVAGETFSKVALPDRIIVLAPNHTGMGKKISLWPNGEWETPLGISKIDDELSKMIQDNFDKVAQDTQAHLMEHSLEVQIPFLQYLKDDFKFVPITLGHLSLEDCSRLGKGIAKAVKQSGKDVLIVASSDMTHYENAKTAEGKDKLAIAKVLELNPEGLFNTVRGERISMCGVIPSTVMLFAVKELGAKSAVLVRYTNSGETSGDYDQVVGYAGMYII